MQSITHSLPSIVSPNVRKTCLLAWQRVQHVVSSKGTENYEIETAAESLNQELEQVIGRFPKPFSAAVSKWYRTYSKL